MNIKLISVILTGGKSSRMHSLNKSFLKINDQFFIEKIISSLKDKWKGNKYLKKNISVHVIFEGMLMCYFGFGMYAAFVVGDQEGDFGLFPFHLMLCIGFGFVFFKSLTSKA
mgnify:CR=1 FL=1